MSALYKCSLILGSFTSTVVWVKRCSIQTLSFFRKRPYRFRTYRERERDSGSCSQGNQDIAITHTCPGRSSSTSILSHNLPTSLQHTGFDKQFKFQHSNQESTPPRPPSPLSTCRLSFHVML